MDLDTNISTAARARTNSGAASNADSGRALSHSKDELKHHARSLVRDGEALLRTTTNLSGEALAQARGRLRGQLVKANARLDAAARTAVDRGRKAAVATDEYVHAKPWPAITVAAAAGIVIGVLLARR